MIFEQSIKDKTPVDEGTEIVLKVSKGAEKVPMPQCVGLTLDAAQELLNRLGIVYQLVPNYGTAYEYNVVYEQSLAAGQEVAPGQTMPTGYI